MLVYIPSHRRTAYGKIRRALRLIGVEQGGIIDIHFPARRIVNSSIFVFAMSTMNDVPDEFLTTFEVKSGANVPVNEYNWDVPPEYLYCFNVNDDEIMTEANEESAPGLVEIVDMEWIAYTGPQNSTTSVPVPEPPIRRLLDLNYYKIHRSLPKAMEIDANATVENRVKDIRNEKKKSTSTAKIRGPYNSYTPHKIQSLIDLVFLCGYSARRAALELGFAVRTAQHYCRQYRLDEDKVLPGKKPQSGGAPKKLFAEHTKFLADYFDGNITATLWQARDELCEKFNISISLAAVHNHLVRHCTVTFKKLEKLPAARVTSRHNLMQSVQCLENTFGTKLLLIKLNLQYNYQAYRRTSSIFEMIINAQK
ncbi:hypothetical protein BDA99DRAFT_534419 [Phascolomyces articulosus]|uniref:Uncharacterized protein n=1 Tax=Phascolomyces articulosus TaxID=60185 RepID=A0AAD5K731_9FUNG|nr:hypothetical protein BDA99DRAFT_534419 [Phascolomyces articulosus]